MTDGARLPPPIRATLEAVARRVVPHGYDGRGAKVDVVGASAGVPHELVRTALAANPAGNAHETTPIVIIRPVDPELVEMRQPARLVPSASDRSG